MKKKVVVAGNICLDITPVFPGEKAMGLSELLRPGKLIHMEAAQVSAGGAVSNTGLAMKFLGADVSLVGKVGQDAFGNLIRRMLGEYEAADGEELVKLLRHAKSLGVAIIRRPTAQGSANRSPHRTGPLFLGGTGRF